MRFHNPPERLHGDRGHWGHKQRRWKWYDHREPFPRKEDFRKMVDSHAHPIELVRDGVPFYQFGGPQAYPPRPPRFIIQAGDTYTLRLLEGKVIDEYKGFWLIAPEPKKR